MIEKEMRDLAWNTFKQTGNINTFIELKQLENMGKEQLGENIEGIQYGNYQNEGNHSFRE